MLKIIVLLNIGVLFILFFCPTSPIHAEEQAQPLVLAHYMPWYRSKEVSGSWGYHWTMHRFDPDKIDDQKRRQIASNTYPLIGAYDSTDPDVINFQVLTMKYAGIDGCIIDWYGTSNFRDYPQIHEASQLFIKSLTRAGLKFAICYEDRTVEALVNQKQIEPEQAISQATKDLNWANKNWFQDPHYVKIGNRPVLLVFGPIYFTTPQSWQQLTKDSFPSPYLYTLPHKAAKVDADGVFGWPPVNGGKTCSVDQWKKYLNTLYQRQDDAVKPIATVFPKFEDLYQKSYGYLDGREGKTFKESLDLALTSQSSIIQLATWNDYGEGTTIEPTREYGYRYLEELQRALKRNSKYVKLPLQLYQLKKNFETEKHQLQITKATKLLYENKPAEAALLLSKVSRSQTLW